MEEPQRKTITRHRDEPKLELGDVVGVTSGVVGVVVARYLKSGDGSGNVHYIVEVRPGDSAKSKPSGAL